MERDGDYVRDTGFVLSGLWATRFGTLPPVSVGENN